MKKLAIITTHPIQYNAPVFKLLTERKNIEVKIFYTWGQDVLKNKFDPGFGKTIEWDIPLLEGYEHCFVENVSSSPGSHHFNGIDNPGLMNVIKNWKADAILVYGWAFKSHLKIMRCFKGKIPVLFRGDSTLLDEKFSMKQLLRRFFLRWVYQFVDKALYTGSANRAYFLAHGMVNQQLVFAGHATDNLRFTATAESKLAGSKIREKLNIPSTAVLFLFAGKLEAKKNPRLLLEAFLESHLPCAHLLITGNGKLEEELKLDFLQQENIHFLDFQNQSAMPAVYCAADVFVLPSSGPGETWGLAINEAMAAGLAVICSNKVGAASDLVNQGINGYVFPAGDKGSLIKLLSLTNDKIIVAQMGKESVAIIRQWNHEKVAAAIEGALQN